MKNKGTILLGISAIILIGIFLYTSLVVGYPLTEPNISCYNLFAINNCSLGTVWCKWNHSDDYWECIAENISVQKSIFFDGFETGNLNLTNWETYSSTLFGRIQVTNANYPRFGSYHLIMDVSAKHTFNLNELITKKNFSGNSNLTLNFWYKHFGDNNHFCPNSWINHTNGDCIAITCDGNKWYNILNLTGLSGWNVYTFHYINLTLPINSYCNGSVNFSFRIKFQQYDNYPITSDGFAFDDINITKPVYCCECEETEKPPEPLPRGNGGGRVEEEVNITEEEPVNVTEEEEIEEVVEEEEVEEETAKIISELRRKGRRVQECDDSDALNYYTKGGGIGIAEVIDSEIHHIILGLEPNPAQPKPSDKPYSIYYDYCINNKNLSEAYCEQDVLQAQTYECPFGCLDGACRANIKDHSKYYEQTAFLISNRDSRLIQELRPIVNWTENETYYEYPLLIYDGRNANEIIAILNSLRITKITAVNDSMINSLLSAASFQNNLLSVNLIEKISQHDYFSFWLNFIGFVYVEDNPSLIQEAADFASSINAPLVVQGTLLDKDKVFRNRHIICFGDLPSNKCNEYKK